jgi:hypothetical protein
MENGYQVVIAIGSPRTHRELEIEFGGYPHRHTDHDG